MQTTLGVIGGGQLGRYFVLAARSHGYRTMVLEPDPNAPAGLVADEHLVANYDDESALARMAAECAAVTVEFENPPVSALEFLARLTVVRPSPEAVAIAQDRMREKELCRDLVLATAPWRAITTPNDIESILESGFTATSPAAANGYILKTARLGYDGKGQVRFDDLSELTRAWDRVGRVPSVLEVTVPLDAEMSVVLARNVKGEMVAYCPTLNAHLHGILDVSYAPIDGALAGRLGISDDVLSSALDTAVVIADHLSYVGVLTVEYFVSNGQLLVNELAPRPHNSGHWTLDAAKNSQFDQQVFTLIDAPLGDTSMTHESVAMGNLLGDRWQHGEPRFGVVEGNPNAHLHLYGKSEARPGRKMGHLTVTGSAANAVQAMHDLREAMTINDGSVVPQ